jgi:hypothetical protein
MKNFLTICPFIIAFITLNAQDKTRPYYYEIPRQPETYTAGTVASRMIDGLGFRYYWATDGLRPEDLAFKPNKDARTSQETINHIYELSVVIVNASTKSVNEPGSDAVKPFSEMRKETLENLRKASEILRKASDSEMNEFKIVFKQDSGNMEYPFWNNLNGPIADVLWHVGQVVSFRRSSGNPLSDKVDVFTGKVRP